jgi:hypothetical protein
VLLGIAKNDCTSLKPCFHVGTNNFDMLTSLHGEFASLLPVGRETSRGRSDRGRPTAAKAIPFR